MTIHVTLPKPLVGATGRTMLLFDLAAGENEFERAEQILADELPGGITSGVGDTPSRHPDFGVTIVPYAYEDVSRDNVKKRLWSAGVISIDPERKTYAPPPTVAPSAQPFDVIKALGLAQTQHHGKDINVAVLDTGIAYNHTDYIGRNIVAEGIGKFQNDDYDDHGHGTHCIGIATGPRPYGIACQANILAGRIYSANTSVDEDQVMKGLTWARDNGAHIVTLSLNWKPIAPEPSPQLERFGRLLLDAGILVIASGARAAGEVTPPANCNSIMAIGSVGAGGKRSSFSPMMMGGRDPVDAVAYGESMLSSWLNSTQFIMSGTSMAAALAGGIAALWAGSNGKYRGAKLWEKMIDAATISSLHKPSFRTTGAGLLVPP